LIFQTTLKHKCLSAVAEDFRGFKTKLMSRYIYGFKKNEDPRELYKAIDEDTWRQFVELWTSEGWQVCLFEIINCKIDNYAQFELIHKVGLYITRKEKKRPKA